MSFGRLCFRKPTVKHVFSNASRGGHFGLQDVRLSWDTAAHWPAVRINLIRRRLRRENEALLGEA